MNFPNNRLRAKQPRVTHWRLECIQRRRGTRDVLEAPADGFKCERFENRLNIFNHLEILRASPITPKITTQHRVMTKGIHILSHGFIKRLSL